MFKITAAASKQIREAARQGGTEGMVLRLAARQKEDGAIDYLMGFDEVKEDDVRIDSEGVEIVMMPEHAELLDETTMDYVEIEEGDFRFIFLNPKDANYTPPQE